MAADLYSYCVGPMPIDDFLHEFVPQNSTPETPEYTYVVKEDCQEADLYPILLDGAKSIMRKHHLLDSSNNPDQLAKSGEKLKPDGMACGVGDGTYIGVTLEGIHNGDKVAQSRKDALGVEEKREKDIFCDMANPGRFESRVTTNNSESIHQVLRYIEEIHTRQPRCFSFFLFFTKHYFRLIRADHDGLIVTERTQWTGKLSPNRLNDFFFRLDHLSREEQGFDTSVRESDDAQEEAVARDALKSYIPDETQIAEPIRKMGVPVKHGEPAKGLRWYYIWAPTVQQRGLRARATCGYPAWDPEEKKIVWIKDSWRSSNKLIPESMVIDQLNEAKVEFAPTLFCGGDLPGPTQQTRTHEFVNASWNRGQRKPHHPRIHHRLAETFGRPLWEFQSSKHLLQMMHDAFTCHRMAVSKCRKLHRDFSAWNILYDPKSKRGILTDWDLCAPMPSVEACEKDPNINSLAQIPNSSGRPDRTGTWMFMSVRTQDMHPHLHTVQDDLEALFWVGVYMITLYMPIPRANALAIVDDVFLAYRFVDGIPTGGGMKAAFLGEFAPGQYSLEFPDSVSPGLALWIDSYKQLIADWLRYLTALKKYRPDPLLDPPTPPDLRDYDKLDEIWRRILEQSVFMDNDRLNDPDHKRDPFHVTAVYRKALAEEADKRADLQAELQWAEAAMRRAEMERGNPRASIKLGLHQNSGGGTSYSNTILERSAVTREDEEVSQDVEEEEEVEVEEEGAHKESTEEHDEEENTEASGLRSPSRLAPLPAGEDAGMGWNSWEETDAADETIEQEAARAAKRQRTTSAGAFRRTSLSDPESSSGPTSPRNRKNSTLQ